LPPLNDRSLFVSPQAKPTFGEAFANFALCEKPGIAIQVTRKGAMVQSSQRFFPGLSCYHYFFFDHSFLLLFEHIKVYVNLQS